MITDKRLMGLAACFALAWAIILVIPYQRGDGGFLRAAEMTLFDWRVVSLGARPPPAELVIVTLDDATRATAPVGEERRQLTRVIEALTAAGAKVLAIDILLTDPGTPDQDAGLAEALGQGRVLLASAASSLTHGGETGLPHASDELWPLERFQERAETGLVNIITDRAGTPRFVPTIYATGRGISPSFALRAAAMHSGTDPEIEVGALRLGDRMRHLDAGFLLPLRPYGPPGTILSISAQAFLDQAATPSLEGKLVVLGNTTTGMGDLFPTPFGGEIAGVEVIASAIGHFLEPDQVLARTPRTQGVDAVAAAGLAVICTVAVMALPLSFGVLAAVALLVGWLAVVWVAFALGLWLAAALPIAAVVSPATVAGVWRYGKERRLSQASHKAVSELKKFHSPELAERTAADPSFLTSPETLQATIMFVDLTGFTSLSQELGPHDTEVLLKRFHRLVTRVVQDHGGQVFNYMGDGALAAFGLLDEADRPSPGAVAAAFDLVAEVRDLGRDLEVQGDLRCRVGLHFGTVILSRLGGDLQQQFSVTGDSVNLASRLLEAAKTEGAAIAATGQTVDATGVAPPRPPDSRKAITLRGRHGEVEILFWS